jgi:hypothetical protein
LLVEIVQEQLLEVSIEGSENAALSFRLDAGVTEEQLQVAVLPASSGDLPTLVVAAFLHFPL